MQDQCCIVTGAFGGIGLETTRRLRALGASVVMADVSLGIAAPDDHQSEGGKAVEVQCDIAEPDQVAHLFDVAEDTFGSVAVLINNAGSPSFGYLAELDLLEFDRVHRINTRGTLLMLREAAQRLADGGRIVNVATSLLRHPLPGLAAYASSKAAVRELSRVAALELGQRGISVNCVLPGPTLPGMFTSASDELRKQAANKSPFSRIGTPADIASVVAFLASGEGAWISGEDVLVNGAATI